MTKQAIIYTRFSPRPDADSSTSCARQAERCRAYCRQRGYEIFSILADENVSGGVLERPGIVRALEYLNETRDRIFIVDSSDRLARDMLVNLTIRHQIEQAGATIEFADGSPDDTTPEGKLFQNMLAAFAAYERDRIRLRTKQGLDRKRKNGEKIGGKIPIGWKLNPDHPKKLIRHLTEREAIKAICELNAETSFSSKEIASELDENFGLCRGKPWSPRTVRKIISREAFWACPLTGDPSLEPTHP